LKNEDFSFSRQQQSWFLMQKEGCLFYNSVEYHYETMNSGKLEHSVIIRFSTCYSWEIGWV